MFGKAFQWIFLILAASVFGCGQQSADIGGTISNGRGGDGPAFPGPVPDAPTAGDVPAPTVRRSTQQPAQSAECGASPGSGKPVSRPYLRSTLPASWDENWFASPALVDIDGDGVLDIVAARHSVLYAWKANGQLLWKTTVAASAGASPEHGDVRMWPSPVVGDFYGDGGIQIAVGSGASHQRFGNLALYNTRGQLLSGWPQKLGGEDEIRSLAAADVNGDGTLELMAVKTSDNPATGVYDPWGNMLPNWPQVGASCTPAGAERGCQGFGGYNQNIGAVDFDGDGAAEVVASTDTIYMGFYRGDGRPLSSASGFVPPVVPGVPAYHDLAMAKQGWGFGDRTEFTDSPPALADLKGTGEPQVILVGDLEHSESVEFRGHVLWVLNKDMTRPEGWLWPKITGAPLTRTEPGNNVVLTLPQPAVGELDGQPGLEIVFAATDGYIHAFRSDGSEYWKFMYGWSANPYRGASEPLLVDLNGDGSSEIIFTTYVSGAPRQPAATPHLIVLSADGKLQHSIPLSGRGSMAAPSIADLEGDGNLELVLSLKDTLDENGQGGVQIWELPDSDTRCMQWPTGRGNLLRNGARAR